MPVCPSLRLLMGNGRKLRLLLIAAAVPMAITGCGGASSEKDPTRRNVRALTPTPLTIKSPRAHSVPTRKIRLRGTSLPGANIAILANGYRDVATADSSGAWELTGQLRKAGTNHLLLEANSAGHSTRSARLRISRAPTLAERQAAAKRQLAIALHKANMRAKRLAARQERAAAHQRFEAQVQQQIHQHYTGNGSLNLGTIHVLQSSTLAWTSADGDFAIFDKDFSLTVTSTAHSGSTVVDPNVYYHVMVDAPGDWTITIEPR